MAKAPPTPHQYLEIKLFLKLNSYGLLKMLCEIGSWIAWISRNYLRTSHFYVRYLTLFIPPQSFHIIKKISWVAITTKLEIKLS